MRYVCSFIRIVVGSELGAVLGVGLNMSPRGSIASRHRFTPSCYMPTFQALNGLSLLSASF